MPLSFARPLVAAAILCVWIPIAPAAQTTSPPMPQPAAASKVEVLQALGDCRKRLDRALDVGFDRIAARCPGLARTLLASEFAAWLPRDWNQPGNDLSAGSLAALERLVERASATAPASVATARALPDVASLGEVLSSLGTQGVERSGLWSRAMRWLRSALERQPEASSNQGWLDRLRREFALARDAWTLLSYLILGVIVVLAAGVVSNELRRSALWRRWRPDSAANDALGFDPGSPTRLSDLDRVPPAERPALLLRQLVQILVARRRLASAVSLTGRELLARRALVDDDDRADVAALVLTAERIRFAPDPPPEATIGEAVRAGRSLLERLTRNVT